MHRSIAIAQQSGNPHGFLGRIIAFIMSIETRSMNKIGLDLLNLQPNDKALELGFGHGKTISKGSVFLKSGIFSGINISKTMLSVAKKNNKHLIDGGKVELKLAEVENIPFEDDYFDKVISVHTIYFWENLSNSINEQLVGIESYDSMKVYYKGWIEEYLGNHETGRNDKLTGGIAVKSKGFVENLTLQRYLA